MFGMLYNAFLLLWALGRWRKYGKLSTWRNFRVLLQYQFIYNFNDYKLQLNDWKRYCKIRKKISLSAKFTLMFDIWELILSFDMISLLNLLLHYEYLRFIRAPNLWHFRVVFPIATQPKLPSKQTKKNCYKTLWFTWHAISGLMGVNVVTS